VNAVAISADGKLVATGSLDGTVTLVGLWLAKNWSRWFSRRARKLSVFSIAPDHGALVAGGRNGKA